MKGHVNIEHPTIDDILRVDAITRKNAIELIEK
jgi:hypothetical protein